MTFLEVRGRRCEDDDGNSMDCRGGWRRWGRWVALLVVLAMVFASFVLFARISARRRRRQGLEPFRGTAWAAGKSSQPQPPKSIEDPAPNQVPPPPPQYNHAAAQYYGSPQQTGTEMHTPPSTYQGFARSGDGYTNKI